MQSTSLLRKQNQLFDQRMKHESGFGRIAAECHQIAATVFQSSDEHNEIMIRHTSQRASLHHVGTNATLHQNRFHLAMIVDQQIRLHQSQALMAHFQSQFDWYNFGSFSDSLFDFFCQFALINRNILTQRLVSKEPSVKAAPVGPLVRGYFTIGRLVVSMNVVGLDFDFPRRGCSFLFPLEHWTRTNKQQQQQQQQQTLAKVKKACKAIVDLFACQLLDTSYVRRR
ncbi:hypothetical protein T07_5410 [Trichinella nelsoni]|uniref:Uncharacterized protein n=1 Tax=Trichinella nelsoni TaxID=6336 RepID=A0A0V0S272_9BILA|nr:hypothetical protein T07_5410 [Trichinella nelsoni]